MPLSDRTVLGRGRAPGKVILLGEHAVVYGRPALAVPTARRGVSVELLAAGRDEGDLSFDLDAGLETARLDDLRHVVSMTRAALACPAGPVRVRIRSSLPPAAGMGSSAALAVALARACAAWAGRALAPAEASALAHDAERLFHGRASGVDNTTSAYARALAFRAGAPPEPLAVGTRFRFLLVHSGVPSSTREAVEAVARRREADPAAVDEVLDRIAAAVEAGRRALADGDPAGLAVAMASNHASLRDLGVSHPAVEGVITGALAAGARAAKVTGAGRGGLVLVLVDGERSGGLRAAFPGALPLSVGPSRPRGSAGSGRQPWAATTSNS